MLSIKNLDGNVLTFTPNGITSTAGNLTVPFVRDAQGRIEQITDPAGKVFRYIYDANGDLTQVVLPDTATPLRYEYDAGHLFRKGFDARGNPEASTTYFPNGRLQSITDAMGKTTSYTYDLVNNITTITHPDNTGSTIQRFDTNGLLLSETDPLNRTTTYTYDANRNKRTETDALNKTTTYDYDANGHVKSVTDPLNRTISYTNNQVGLPATATDQLNKTRTLTYDANNNLTSINDELGTQFAMTWNERGNATSFTDANGRVTRFTYDAFGNIVSRIDPLGRTTAYTYDQLGRVVSQTDGRGVSRFEYDAFGRTTSVTDQLNNKTVYTYDANGNQKSMLDARGKLTEYEYDAANRLSKVSNPDGTTRTYTYNFRGQKLTDTISGPPPALGFYAVDVAAEQFVQTTSYEYDNAGQLIKIINPDLSEVKLTYDEVGRVKTITDELNKTVSYEFDQGCGCKDRLAKITDPDGKSISYTYDAAGRRVSFIDASNRETRYIYDTRNRLTKTIYPDNTFTEVSYDGDGHPLTQTDQEGRVTRSTYDEFGNLLTVTNPNGGLTQYTYDDIDNLISITNPNGRVTQFEYDAMTRLIKKTLPLGMSELYTYDQVGNLATRLDYRGKQSTYEYDAMNRLTARRPDPTLGEVPITFTYNETGKRRTMSDASGTTTYAYDIRDRLITKETPQGTLNYTYDLAGGLTSMVSSNVDGVSVNYEYDDEYRLTKVKDNRASVTPTAYTYDQVGNLESTTRSNGVRSNYTYNAVNRLLNLVTSKGGTTQSSYAYTVDRTGRRLSVTEASGRVVTYTYDNAYRLKREAVTGDPSPAKNGAVDYTVDAFGNRLSRISSLAGVLSATSNYDANDRLTSDVFDANGNTRSANGHSFTYDFEDRIRSADGGAVRIVYDGDGNLASKTAGGVTTKYLIDEENPTGYSQVVEEIVDGEVQRQYTYGHAIVSQRRRTQSGWAVNYYTADGHGNIRQLTDESGAVTDTYDYDAFGKLLSQTGTTPNPYLYAGERFDAELGLYHLRARHYDPDRGRFMSMDPYPGEIDEPASLHKYLYTFADPVNYLDPSGMATLAEYGMKIRLIALRVISAVYRLGRAIACVFLRVASIIASMVSLSSWWQVVLLAAQLLLSRCPCKIKKKPGTILGENMKDRVGPFARRTGGRPLPWAGTPEQWDKMTPRQRWKANDRELRKRIRAGDSFRYIGPDPNRSDAARRRFDLTRSELDRLRDRGIPWEDVPIEEILCVLGRP